MEMLRNAVSKICSPNCWLRSVFDLQQKRDRLHRHEQALEQRSDRIEEASRDLSRDLERRLAELEAKERFHAEQVLTQREEIRRSERQLQQERRQLEEDAVRGDRSCVGPDGWLAGVNASRFHGVTMRTPYILVKASEMCSKGDGQYYQCSCLIALSRRQEARKKAICLIAETSEFVKDECKVCFESVAKSAGLPCASGHFVCDFCLEKMVTSSLDEGVGRLQQDQGHIWCPLRNYGCDAGPFSKQRLASHLPSVVWEHVCQVQEEVIKENGRQEERQLQRQREVKQVDAIHPYVCHVTEQILTHRCPRCQQAFVDFTGCLALKCHKCSAGFCGLCFADCGQDAHNHVRVSCPWRRRVSDVFFMREEEWQHFHKEKQDEKIQHYLSSLPHGTQASVAQAIRALR